MKGTACLWMVLSVACAGGCAAAGDLASESAANTQCTLVPMADDGIGDRACSGMCNPAGGIGVGQTDGNPAYGGIQYECACVDGALRWYTAPVGTPLCATPPPPPTEGAVHLRRLTHRFTRNYHLVEQSGDGIPRYDAHGGEPQPHQCDDLPGSRRAGGEWCEETLSVLEASNDFGLRLLFVYDGAEPSNMGGGAAPYGARLLSATFDGRELLYVNPQAKKTRWGHDLGGHTQGWLGMGGAESAFPVDEHGYYGATSWDYDYRFEADGDFVFTASFSPERQGNRSDRLKVAVSYTVPADGAYWRTRIRIENPDPTQKRFQYWHNYMMPAGNDPHRDTYRVYMDGVTDVEVHSTADACLATSGQDMGAHSQQAWVDGGRISRIHGPQGQQCGDAANVQGWLGMFNLQDQRIERYGFLNENPAAPGTGWGIGMVANGARNAFYPKAFGGPNIGTSEWTGGTSRYVEMWYSPTNRSFWPEDEYILGEAGREAADGTQLDVIDNETIQFPFFTEQQYRAFRADAPWAHLGGVTPTTPEPGPVEPEPGEPEPSAGGDLIHESFDGAGQPFSDGRVDGTVAAGFYSWYDEDPGNPWSTAMALAMTGDAQVVGLERGSFGLCKDYGDRLGGVSRTLHLDYSFSGSNNPWFEVLVNDPHDGGQNRVFRRTSNDGSSDQSIPLPAGSRVICFKVGTGGGGARAILRDLRVL